MSAFTIETMYRLPLFRHRTFEASSVEHACRLAIDDDDRSRGQRDYEMPARSTCPGSGRESTPPITDRQWPTRASPERW